MLAALYSNAISQSAKRLLLLTIAISYCGRECELTAEDPYVSVGLSKIVVNPRQASQTIKRPISCEIRVPMASTQPSLRSCITFLTDFGTRDTYAAQMKGVALGINPDIQFVDLTHEIPPQQILRGAFVWNDSVAAFPAGTIHVGVVDPGDGSDRRLVAAEIGEYRFVCPDNGLLTVILQNASLHRAVSLDNRKWWRKSVSNTFHGRDILTPVAAHWSLGVDLAELGTPLVAPLFTLALSNKRRGQTSIIGQIVDVDRFGNLVTDIEPNQLPPHRTFLRFEIGAFHVNGLSTCYADVDEGEPLVLIGSSGRLEISIRNGNAAEELQADFGCRVVARWERAGS